MAQRFPSVIKDFPRILHGGDYNPDQWLHRPGIIDDDFRLMKLAGCNTFSVGIFAWVSYEPREGEFSFDWLDMIMKRMADNGNKVFLATPSGSKPAWMSKKYAEVCRVMRTGLRDHHHGRHNHCFTSPVYRDKVAKINSLLASRYATHPALAGWHISNEYSGECFCDLCLDAFRFWLRSKYGSLENLNTCWWNAFWSHNFMDWSEIDPRDYSVDGMTLDWNRFVTSQTCDFMRQEAGVLKKFTPDIPVTTNMMGFFQNIDYWRIAQECDFVSDDSYPSLHKSDDNSEIASWTAMAHDMHRSMKQGKPFVMMESSPSATNWMPIHKVKRPGVHRLEMLQAIGHGADGSMYFQWRKGQGGHEKFHGAVVDHVGTADTRVFKDVSEVGDIFGKLERVTGTSVAPAVAVIYDWEVRWALEMSGGPSNDKKKYTETCHTHYSQFWRQGIPVDVIESTCSFAPYKLLIAPMLFMLKKGVAEKLRAFVEEQGGTLVLTYLSGVVDEYNRCFTGGWPGAGLRQLSGVWAEEIDGIYDTDIQHIVAVENALSPVSGSYAVKDYCMLIHAESATALGKYADDFYAGRPALTCRDAGKGKVYYIAARTDNRFLADLYRQVLKSLDISSPFPGTLAEGVTVQMRTDGSENFYFLLNPTSTPKEISIDAPDLNDMLSGKPVLKTLHLEANGSAVLCGPARINDN